MAQNPVYTGHIWGDDTGDPAPVAFGKINGDIAALYAAFAAAGFPVGLNYASAPFTTASVDNFTLGGTFPTGTYQLDLLCNTSQVSWSGMQAGTYNGQVLLLRNSPSSTFNLVLTIENAGSNPSNRWSGPGTTLVLLPGFMAFATYSTSNSRWWLK